MKNLFLIFSFILLLGACDNNQARQEKVSEVQVSLPEDLTTIYSYNKDSLSEECPSDNEIVCAIDKIVKCALNPKLSLCDSKNMPEFLFYDDSIFAEDNVEGRPSEQSFKILKHKILDDHTIEVYTEGQCDHNWFGACQGNIIYIMDNGSGQWLVKDLYAVETIK